VEAGLNSGSLITASLATEFKRKVFAIPGPINSSLSGGTFQLIHQGAAMVTQANDVLGEYGMTSQANHRPNQKPLALSESEKQVIQQLEQEPKDIDSLSGLIDITVAHVDRFTETVKAKPTRVGA